MERLYENVHVRFRMKTLTTLALTTTIFMAPYARAQVEEQTVANPATFTELSKNVFSQSCTSCHMTMSAKEPAEAGIDLSSYALMVATNNNKKNPKHAPFIIPGDPDHSKLYVAVLKGKMPATEDGSKAVPLSAAQIQNIYDWIKAGALDN